MRLAPILFAATLALLPACDDAATEPDATTITITTARMSYAPGEALVVTLRNDGTSPVAHSFCPQVLERRAGATGWTTVASYPPPGAGCTMELQTLAPGATVTVRLTLPGTLVVGEHRVRFPGVGDRSTNPFAIVDAPG